MKRLYIAYGSNLNVRQMKTRCPNAKILGTAKLKGWELLFKGSKSGSYLTIEKKENGIVPVVIWEVSESDEKALDRYEGYPRLYDKQMMDVELDGKPVSAMVYIMTPGHEFGIPSDYYVDTIWQGYESAGFDTQILEDAVEKAIELTRYQEQQEATEQTSLFGMGGIK